MGLLSGRNAVIMGVANEHSIAWGIAEALKREGAHLAFSYAVDTMERRVRPLGEAIGASYIGPCDVREDEQLVAFFDEAAASMGRIDTVVHAIAFSNKEDLRRPVHEVSRAGYLEAIDISSYSLIGVAQAALPHMGEGASILTMTYMGAEKVVPGYGLMGPVKADLEATMRYLAASLGEHGVRVNAISAGPVRTLAARGIPRFAGLLDVAATASPLGCNVSTQCIGDVAACLCSPMFCSVTGEVIHVDCGFNIMGVPAQLEAWKEAGRAEALKEQQERAAGIKPDAE